MANAFDAVASATSAPASTSLTYAHTCTGSNRILFVGVSLDDAAVVVTGVTYNGVAMTNIGNLGSGGARCDLWYLINPASGSHNVVVSISSGATIISHAFSYTGAKQSGVPDASTTGTDPGTTLAMSVTTTANNCWVVAYVRGGSSMSAGASTTMRGGSDRSNPFDSNGPVTPAGSRTLNASSSASPMVGVIASFAPAPIPPAGAFFLRMAAGL